MRNNDRKQLKIVYDDGEKKTVIKLQGEIYFTSNGCLFFSDTNPTQIHKPNKLKLWLTSIAQTLQAFSTKEK